MFASCKTEDTFVLSCDKLKHHKVEVHQSLSAETKPCIALATVNTIVNKLHNMTVSM